MKYLIISIVTILSASFSFGMNKSELLVPIFFDVRTEKKIGQFFDRKLFAEAIHMAKKYQAKALVLKVFIDFSKKNDDLLAKAIKDFPVFLQACVNRESDTDNHLPDKFEFKDIREPIKKIIQGKSGWIPLEIFSQNALDVGFVNIRGIDRFESVPLLTKYNGKIYKSLYFSILKYLYPEIKFEANNFLLLGSKKVPLNEYNEVKITLPKQDNLFYFSLIDFLEEKIDPKQIKGKVIILGTDANNISSLKTDIGEIKVHRLFFYHLKNLIEKFE